MATVSSYALEILLKRIESLEDRVAELESELIVSKDANKLLSQKVDDLHQHQRRAYKILDGITPLSMNQLKK